MLRLTFKSDSYLRYFNVVGVRFIVGEFHHFLVLLCLLKYTVILFIIYIFNLPSRLYHCITVLVGVRKRVLGGLKLSSWIYSNICFTDINKRVML